MLSVVSRASKTSIAREFGPSLFELSDAIFARAKELALAALERNSGHEFNAILKKYPQLLNHPLNPQGQTPLILATLFAAEDIIRELLKKNADLYYQDQAGKSAMDYAAEDSALHTLLREKYFFLTRLRKKIFSELTSKNKSVLQKKLLNLCYDASNLYDSAIEKALDLYCTLNSVLQIVLQHPDETLPAEIKLFFALRENFLKGEQHDYCYGFSFANQFCCQLAEWVFPDAHAPNVLLAVALHEDRDEPWENITAFTHHLPASPRDYFRNADNQIQLYLPLIKQAIAKLKKGNTNPQDIWLSFDAKRADSPAALSPDDIRLLSKRTPTLKTLVDYTERLQVRTTQQGTTFLVRFRELFEALERGDMFHTGMDNDSGPSAYVSLHQFALWWNSLDETTQQEIKSISLRGFRPLGEIIDILLDPKFDDTGAYRNLPHFCTNINSTNGKSYLNSSAVRARLLDIERVANYSVSEKQLTEWLAAISWELQHYNFQVPLKNFFVTLNQYSFLQELLQKQPHLLTYENIAVIKSILELEFQPGENFTPQELAFGNQPVSAEEKLNPLLLYLARNVFNQQTPPATAAVERLKLFSLIELLNFISLSNVTLTSTQLLTHYQSQMQYLLSVAVDTHSALLAENLLRLGGRQLITSSHVQEAFKNNSAVTLQIMLTYNRELLQENATLLVDSMATRNWDCIDVYFECATITRPTWEIIKPFIISTQHFTAAITQHALQHNDDNFLRDCKMQMPFAHFNELTSLASRISDTKTFLALFYCPLPQDLRQRNVINDVLEYLHTRILLQGRGQEYHTFWSRAREKFSATLKINAAKKVICYLLQSKVAFSQQEVDALQEGKLGKILRKYIVVLPKDAGEYNMQELKDNRDKAAKFRKA